MRRIYGILTAGFTLAAVIVFNTNHEKGFFFLGIAIVAALWEQTRASDQTMEEYRR